MDDEETKGDVEEGMSENPTSVTRKVGKSRISLFYFLSRLGVFFHEFVLLMLNCLTLCP